MMRAVEEHLAEWARRQLSDLNAESKLFGTLRVVPAGQDSLPTLPAGETGIQVSVAEVHPLVDGRDIGLANGIGDYLLQVTAGLHLRLFGTEKPLAGGDAGILQPTGIHMHRVDLVLLTLLALLRERQNPAPDGNLSALPPPAPGAAPGGAASAEEGSRRARLDWQLTAIGPAAMRSDGSKRLWELPLTAACTFRLSVRPLEGGRILQVGAKVTGSDGVPGQMEMTVERG